MSTTPGAFVSTAAADAIEGPLSLRPGAPAWRRLLTFTGPGLLVAVGYMDPGNWATDIEAGSRFGYGLLAAVLASSLAAIVLQLLSMKLGVVARADLAQLTRQRFGRRAVWINWVLAEIAIIACDVAEVLGCALAFKLAFHLPLAWGVLLTGFDTLIVLGLQGRGFRKIEAIILGLILTVGGCFLIELMLLRPAPGAIWRGFLEAPQALGRREGFYLAIGIVGATIMPHNLYLHSALVRTRRVAPGEAASRQALRLAGTDIVAALLLAMLVNAAILIMAGAAFHRPGSVVTDIEGAYHLLEPVTGAGWAAIVFAVALFASGQSSTMTGTLAGQVILEGFLNLKIAPWLRRLITRGLAILPALAGVLLMGETSVGRLLVMSQVVLSIQLPFAIYALVRLTDDKALMGRFANGPATSLLAWTLMLAITGANLWLMAQLVVGG